MGPQPPCTFSRRARRVPARLKYFSRLSLRITGSEPLGRRLKTLATIRTDEGYMANVKSQPGGAFLLVENHCPICAAATACTGLCAKELEVFQTVLGDDIAITRTEHIVAGARRCAYRVCPLAADARSGR